MTSDKLSVAVSPHIREGVSIPRIMYSVIIALVPALIGSVFFFGPRALWLTLIGVASAVATEAGYQALRKVPIEVSDGSAALTGLLVAFNLPPGVPLWMPVVGSFVGILLGKQVFGGLGRNVLNPALVGRAFLMASWPVEMTTKWIVPRYGTLSGIDAVTSGTPLNVFKNMNGILSDPAATLIEIQKATDVLNKLADGWGNLLLGNIGGCVGETSALLLLIGALFLLWKGYADWRIPVGFLVGLGFFSWAFWGKSGLFTGHPLFHIFTGGVILGAFFMATDMVTSPITPKGRWMFGLGCGTFTFIIRKWGGYPEGVSYAILLMNILTPLIDRYTKPKAFGDKKDKQKEQK